jgi:sortase A
MVDDIPLSRRRSILVLVLASVSTAALVGYAAARESGGEASPLESSAVDSVTSSLPSTTTTVESTTTTVPPTTSTTTSTTSTTTSTTSTTTSTTSTTLPTPEPPPTDERAPEPVIELGTIEIPAIDVSMTMYEGIRLSTLDRGPGHWPGTAMPGQTGNVVVAGHRVSKHQVFRNIDALVEGDEILFTDTAGALHRYRVTSSRVVVPTEVWIVDPTPTPTATLFACHPPGSVRERYVVFAELVT